MVQPPRMNEEHFVMSFQWAYEGVPYLNEEQETRLKTHLANNGVEDDGFRYAVPNIALSR